MSTSMRFVHSMVIGRCTRLFSRFNMPTFQEIPLEKRLLDRLKNFNIVTLTEIQKKSLQPVINGKNVIINSETGSGKTLCYLIPILNRLMSQVPMGCGPSALILTPNMHLGFQITEIFNNLADPGIFASPVYRDMKLHIHADFPVIVSTPQTLLQYNLKCLPTLETVVIDEADLIIANGGKLLWNLLNSLRKTHSQPDEDVENSTQFIFVAATLPHRGEKSVLWKIRKWMPDIVNITSSMVHQYAPTVHTTDVVVAEEEKLENLIKYLNMFSKEYEESVVNRSGKNEVKSEFLSHQSKRLKVLVFVNTVSKAKDVFEFLNKHHRTVKITTTNRGNSLQGYGKNIDKSVIDGSISMKTKDFYKETGSIFSSWIGKVGALHKDVGLPERETVLEEFKRGELVVLVCTDLGSRGLDIPDVSHVIQLDYASNAADVLHRAGRTARAGAWGSVINFITEKDQDLMKAVKETDKGPGAEGFQEIFSRNRMFSKRIKKKLSKEIQEIH